LFFHILTCSCWQTLRFCIRLLVIEIAGASAPSFSFQPIQELLDFDIDVGSDDVLHNLVTKETQMMRGTISWQGCRKKDPLLFQMLIEATTSAGDIVMDCSASTGLIMYLNLSVLICLQLCFNSSNDQFMFPYYSPLLLQVPLCTHIERRADISLC
jgi:hypothetical protein